MQATPTLFTPDDLRQIGLGFEGQAPEEILRWGVQTFGPDLALATGFGPEGVVLMHMLSQITPDATMFYLDTDLLFDETYALRDALQARLGVTFTRVHSGLSLEARNMNEFQRVSTPLEGSLVLSGAAPREKPLTLVHRHLRHGREEQQERENPDLLQHDRWYDEYRDGKKKLNYFEFFNNFFFFIPEHRRGWGNTQNKG